MPPTAGNNLFLLEAIAHRVALVGPDAATDDAPTTDACVCFRFPGLVDLEICERGPCDDGTGNRPRQRARRGRDVIITMDRGNSCLFAVGASDLCRAAREFRAAVNVYRRRADGAPRLVAHAALRFDRTFTDVILNPDQPQRTRELVQTLSLYESGDGSRRAGTVDVLVRLTSHGDLLVTEFFWDRDTKTYKYEGLDEYVPTTTNAPAPSEDCPEKRRPCPRKCCGRASRKSGGREKPAATMLEVHDKCFKHVRRVKCILDVMDKMKSMFLGVTAAAAAAANGRRQPDAADVAKPCAFDPRCPVAGCPFVLDEPTRQKSPAAASAPVPLASPKRTAGRPVEPPPRAAVAEIVDGSDVFGVTVGRVDDPCPADAPEHRDGFAQYSVADLPPSDEPGPPPPPPPPPSEVVVDVVGETNKPSEKKKSKKKTKGKKQNYKKINK